MLKQARWCSCSHLTSRRWGKIVEQLVKSLVKFKCKFLCQRNFDMEHCSGVNSRWNRGETLERQMSRKFHSIEIGRRKLFSLDHCMSSRRFVNLNFTLLLGILSKMLLIFVVEIEHLKTILLVKCSWWIFVRKIIDCGLIWWWINSFVL